MKPLSERDENNFTVFADISICNSDVGMKPLSERDENHVRG